VAAAWNINFTLAFANSFASSSLEVVSVLTWRDHCTTRSHLDPMYRKACICGLS